MRPFHPRASELQEAPGWWAEQADLTGYTWETFAAAPSDERADDADYWQEALWEELADEQESLPGPDPQPEPPTPRCPDCLRSYSACVCETNPFAD